MGRNRKRGVEEYCRLIGRGVFIFVTIRGKKVEDPVLKELSRELLMAYRKGKDITVLELFFLPDIPDILIYTALKSRSLHFFSLSVLLEKVKEKEIVREVVEYLRENPDLGGILGEWNG